MLRLAFSTVACPEWTLERVARFAADSGYSGVELRTLGAGSTQLACDPALTAWDKTRALFEAVGVAVAGLGTSARFDAPISPPVIGCLRDNEREVREAERHLDEARGVGAGYVRVFAFEPAPGERRAAALKRIVERLRLAADHARWGSQMLALENGGGFPRAADALEIVDRVGHPLVGVCYNALTGALAGDDPGEAIDALAGDLLAARVKDVGSAGWPCLPGEGRGGCEAFVRRLAQRDFGGWVVFEWDRAWLADLAPAEETLAAALARLLAWSADPASKTNAPSLTRS